MTEVLDLNSPEILSFKQGEWGRLKSWCSKWSLTGQAVAARRGDAVARVACSQLGDTWIEVETVKSCACLSCLNGRETVLLAEGRGGVVSGLASQLLYKNSPTYSLHTPYCQAKSLLYLCPPFPLPVHKLHVICSGSSSQEKTHLYGNTPKIPHRVLGRWGSLRPMPGCQVKNAYAALVPPVICLWKVGSLGKIFLGSPTPSFFQDYLALWIYFRDVYEGSSQVQGSELFFCCGIRHNTCPPRADRPGIEKEAELKCLLRWPIPSEVGALAIWLRLERASEVTWELG